MTAFSRRTILSLLAASGAVACTDGLKQPYPEKHFFLIDCPRPNPLPSANNGLVLSTRPFEVSPSYRDRGLVLRTGQDSWRTDFYNAFFIAPAAMVENVTAQWFEHAGLFSAVTEGASRLLPTHALEGVLTGLYGDVSGGGGKSVIEMELLLLDIRSSANVIVAKGDYTKSQPAASMDPEALIAGWNAGLGLILSEFESAVRNNLTQPRT